MICAIAIWFVCIIVYVMFPEICGQVEGWTGHGGGWEEETTRTLPGSDEESVSAWDRPWQGQGPGQAVGEQAAGREK